MTERRCGALPGHSRVDAKKLAAARELYETRADISQADICRRLGISAGTLAYHARNGGWIRAEGARMHRSGGARDKRAKLVARLYRAFERQVGELEDRLGARLQLRACGERMGEAGGDAPAFDDRDARLLSTLAQTLARLVTLDTAWNGTDAADSPGAKAQGAGGQGAGGQGEGDEDLDEFRRSLAQRLEALIESPDRGASGKP